MSDTPAPPPPCDGATRLTEWGLIRASGADCTSFLQSQLTQDMAALHGARLAGYCSPKGRLLASFVTWRSAEGDIWLACSADLLAATLKRLSMFVLRARCTLVDASAPWPLYGLAGPSAAAWLGDAAAAPEWSHAELSGAQLVRLSDSGGVARWLLASGTAPALPAADADAWSWLEVRSAVPRITAATSEQFVPQMVNLELLGGVNFRKGCYPGQEVVARSQYRGTLKRRAYLVESDQALAPGAEVFQGDDASQPAGMVVLAASLPGGRHAALVELKIAAAEGAGGLRTGTGARLRLQPLPYALAGAIDCPRPP